MKCMNCGKEYSDAIIFKITDKKGTKCFCPNCAGLMEAYDELILENDDDLLCDVTGKYGAVIFSSGNEVYSLDKEIMHRLLKYNLKPEEYLKLKEIGEEKSKGFQYMIHDDFYTEDGIAIQPID